MQQSPSQLTSSNQQQELANVLLMGVAKTTVVIAAKVQKRHELAPHRFSFVRHTILFARLLRSQYACKYHCRFQCRTKTLYHRSLTLPLPFLTLLHSLQSSSQRPIKFIAIRFHACHLATSVALSMNISTFFFRLHLSQ